MLDGGIVSPGPPSVVFYILFNCAMDTTVLPSFGNFTILSDGVPKAVTAFAWAGATALNVQYTGSVPSVSGTFTIDNEDVNLRCSGGSLVQAPQTVNFFP